jgi:hypothetical protein
METERQPEYQTALHFARLWLVTALQGGMPRDAATEFAVEQAAAYLADTSPFSQVRREGVERIRVDLESIRPSPTNPLRRHGPVDTTG